MVAFTSAVHTNAVKTKPGISIVLLTTKFALFKLTLIPKQTTKIMKNIRIVYIVLAHEKDIVHV